MLEGRRQGGEQQPVTISDPRMIISLVLERAGTLDLAVLLGAIARPLQRGPGDRRHQERGQQAEWRIEIDIGRLRRIDRGLVEVWRSAGGDDEVIQLLREGLRRGAEEEVQHETERQAASRTTSHIGT